MIVIVIWFFLTVPWFGLQCVIVVFPDQTHLFFLVFYSGKNNLFEQKQIHVIVLYYKPQIWAMDMYMYIKYIMHINILTNILVVRF